MSLKNLPSNIMWPKQTYYWPILSQSVAQYKTRLNKQDERRSESAYFAKSLLLGLLLDCKIIDLDCNMSRSKVKDTVTLVVLMHQMKCAQWVE